MPCRRSCWPITRPFLCAKTWTSRGTSPNRSQWSDGRGSAVSGRACTLGCAHVGLKRGSSKPACFMAKSDPPPMLRPGALRPRRSARARLRNYFLTGLIVGGPLAITLYITWWFIKLVDAWVKPFVPTAYLPESHLPFPIPGFGLIVAFTALTLLGFLTANLVGRSFINFGETALDRMPVVRGIYRGVKQIFETVFKQDGHSFRQVGLIEWPGEGLWSLCFITEPAQGALAAALPP